MFEPKELIYLNNFCDMHEQNNVRFCKTDFLEKEFEIIRNLDKEIILITGNSDYPITDKIANLAPKNIKKWYAENCITNNDLVEPLPLGLENIREASRKGHGVSWEERAVVKERLMSRDMSHILPTKDIYANFKIATNPQYRYRFASICENCEFIEYEEPNLSLEQFFDKILKYKMIACPIGNGVDTHRLWEVLYSGRVPVTVKVGDFKIYELYDKLPVVVLENERDLLDKDLIYSKYEQVKNKSLEYATMNFWKNKLKNCLI